VLYKPDTSTGPPVSLRPRLRCVSRFLVICWDWTGTTDGVWELRSSAWPIDSVQTPVLLRVLGSRSARQEFVDSGVCLGRVTGSLGASVVPSARGYGAALTTFSPASSKNLPIQTLDDAYAASGTPVQTSRLGILILFFLQRYSIISNQRASIGVAIDTLPRPPPFMAV
jgi:hypothetical protein